MYFSYDWVKQYLQNAPTLEEAAAFINSTGLETEIENDGLEVEHTVNRPDAMCHFGIARELHTKAGCGLIEPPVFNGELPHLEGWVIESDDAEHCPRYLGLLVENVKATPSPAWLQERLAAIDQTCHNLLVDLTNFLLWEFSQPTHAFDADKLRGNHIRVRFATKGEQLTTLDGRDHEVENLLCITDDGGPIALAGVMGGKNSEVDENTTRLLLELAMFRGSTARRTGKAVNIHSDARHRYERGVDQEHMERVIRRFVYLLQQEQPQVRVIGLLDMNLKPFERGEVHLRRTQLDRLLGIHLEDAEVLNLLVAMDFRPEVTEAGWRVATPGFKVDVHREADVIEEIIRFAGLDRLSATLPSAGGSDYKPDPLLVHENEARETLRAMGLQEAITFGFSSVEADSAIACAYEPVTLRNPMSNKQAVMRRNLLPNLLECVRNNQARGLANLGLFEIGHTFAAETEPHHLAVALAFGKDQNHWWGDLGVHPFYRIKGVYETLARKLDFSELELRPQAPTWLKPGEALGIWRKDVCLGGLGTVAADLAERFELGSNPVVLEMDISFLHGVGQPGVRVGKLSNLPCMKIDLAFVLNKEHAYQQVSDHIHGLDLPNLESLWLFDVYEGKALEKDQKSLGFRFRFRASDRTLTSEEVSAVMGSVRDSVCQRFGATIRM